MVVRPMADNMVLPPDSLYHSVLGIAKLRRQPEQYIANNYNQLIAYPLWKPIDQAARPSSHMFAASGAICLHSQSTIFSDVPLTVNYAMSIK